MDIKNNIKYFLNNLSNSNCKLVAVSKTKPNADIQVAYDAGQRIFGENKVQELVDKHESLSKDIEWHMIGHLQRNKVKYIAPFVSLIHSVDSPRLLKEINKQGEKADRQVNCLLQIHIADEDTKFGFAPQEVKDFLLSQEFGQLSHIKIVGLMGMATNTTDLEQVRKEFAGLRQLQEDIKSMETPNNVEMTELSMGMSGDYEIAIEEGSTLVRVGSAIFGSRN
ncbi:MAG: YggS family pyridoxal phosphate-dependent enzyme [Bacteroidota bacterium]